MSSQKFESYDDDIEDILDKVSKKLEIGISNKESDEQYKRNILKLDRSLEEAKILLNKMENEARQAPAKHQGLMKSKISKYTLEIQRHRKSINDQRYSSVLSNRAVNPISYNNPDNLESDVRRQILMGTTSLERTSESIARSHMVALETEQLGTEVLGELGTQRETLERTRNRLGETQEEISRSRRLLRMIGNNFCCNKLLIIIIIILEIGILGALCYWKFFM